MDWLFESLKANSASIRYVAGAIASLTGALFLWVCKIGGETSVFKWLSDIQTQRRAEAKAKIRIGLKSAQKESDEEKLDSLIVGLDQWKQLTNKLRGWKRSVRAGKWSIAALFITCFGLIASNILTTGYRVVEASFAVA